MAGYKKGNKKELYNREFFTQMYVDYYTQLVAYIHQFTNNLSEAEDIAQTSFTSIWDKRNQLNIKGSFKGYLFGVAYNLFIDAYRKHKKEILLAEQLKKESLDELIPENNDEISSKLALLEQAIDELPTKCRQIFELHKKDGLSYKSVAKQLEISLKTVESQMRIAMIKIREKFNAE